MKTLLGLLILTAVAFATIEENRGIEDPDLFEGDIKLTEDQRAGLEAGEGRTSITTRLWPNGVIVYDLESSIDNNDMPRLNAVIAEYRQKTCIRFKKRTTETAYISVFKGSGCWSYVGRTGRKQQLSLARGCWSQGTVIHEFAHALGIFHEQSRADRDQYVTIKFENIRAGREGNFKKQLNSVNHGTPYDYGSVMHYSSRAFSKNGQPTIVPKKQGAILGQRRGLSPIDVEQINKMYKCGNIPTKPPPVTQPPSNGFSCNFDRDTCGFAQSRNDKFDWSRKSGGTPSGGTGPGSDHTSGKGFYMYIETSSPRKPNDNAIISKQVTLTGNNCLRFYYHMLGRDVNTLNVRLGNVKIFTKSGSQGNNWLKAEVRLPGSGVQTISFEGIRGSSWQGDIAIDDVSITNCGGPPPTQPPTPPPTQPPTPPPPTQPPTPPPPTRPPAGFKCDFEKSCGFIQRKDDKFDWTRRKGRTPSSQTGPDTDHTSKNGYYMYIETSSPRRDGDNAVIETSVSVGSNTCLTFFYHMYGFHIGTLNVRLGKSVVFTKTGPQGNKWIKAEVKLGQSGTQMLSFEGIRAKGYSGDIAIDDISVGTCGSVIPPTQPPTQGPPPPPGSCGTRPHTRIVGGTAAKHGDWPWQVQLRTTSGFPYCGGSLIHPQWILTATHCVSRKQPSSIVIRLGAHRRVNTVGTEQDIRVSKVITHPSYHKPTTYSHDIALLKLEKPALLNKNVNLVCLPDNVPAPTDGKHCWITGWGRLSSGGATPDYLQQVSVPIASRARCDKSYPGKIHDSMICAGLDQGGKDSCQGDSGGPMVCETGGRFYVHGATSWGYGCASPGKFGVYAKVTYLLPWIKSEMAKN